MRLHYNLFSVLMSVILLTSCLAEDEEIKIKTNEPGLKPVIEAELSTDTLQSHVTLSWLSAFGSTEAPQPIRNGVVVIKDSNTNHVDTLIESKTMIGKYVKLGLKAIVGHTYLLSVSIDGKVYTSKSTIGSGFEITSLRYDLIRPSDYLANLGFNVPIDSTHKLLTVYGSGYSVNTIQNSNYAMRLILYVDGSPVQKNLLQQVPSSYNDDQLIRAIVSDTVFSKMKNISVEAQVFDISIYNYLKEVSEVSAGTQAAPVNPPSNIAGGALGYFFAHSSSAMSVNYVPASVKVRRLR